LKNSKKNSTTAKGYRLTPETHLAIKQIRAELKCSQDWLISEAIKFYRQLNKKNINGMKKLKILLIGISFILGGLVHSQTNWVWQNPKPTGYDMNAVYFINSSTGFIGGANGELYRTTNSGSNWVRIQIAASETIQSICFTDANTGYLGAGQFSCLMYKTTNGGLNWAEQNLNLQYGPRSINFINSLTGVAAHQSTDILKTTNGGVNWTSIATSITYNAGVWMTSAATIYAAGSTGITRSTNGGINWVTQATISGDLLTICFTDSLNGIAAGRNGLMLRTSNGGINWNPVTASGMYDIYMVRYLNAGNVFACGQGGAVGRSTNGGLNWIVTYPAETYFNVLYSIHPLNSNDIYTSGAYGTICRSSNSGANWGQLFAGINNDLYYSHFTDDNNGYATSFNSVIKTTDGGANWTKLNSISFGGPVYFRNANTGYQAAMSAGLLYKTTNGGANYTALITGYPSSFRSIYFTGDNTGYLVTSNAKILKTTNAGTNWQQIDSTVDAFYADIFFSDSVTAYVSGYKNSPAGALVKKTTNGGVSWTEQTISSTLAMTSLHFVNNNTGFAGSNSSGQNFFRTTNGGLNWTAGASVNPYINDMYFVNENTGYTCSLFGRLYRTTNGGNNWIQLAVPVDYNIRTLYHNSNSGVTYVLGAGGMILKSTNGSVTGFGQNENLSSYDYTLEQNYPNPFNPITKISVQLPNDGYVNLTVFDITGKEISVLLDGNLKQGKYNVDFEGSNFPSGVYFYRLQTNEFTSTRKMILIK
jgi:photosystem II stability/assembly factor-like uncharacterized protein